jgi:hypothetical protein
MASTLFCHLLYAESRRPRRILAQKLCGIRPPGLRLPILRETAELRSAGQARRPTLLIPQVLFDDVYQRLALAVALELGEEEAHGLLRPVAGVVGAVRAEEYVLEFVERVALG